MIWEYFDDGGLWQALPENDSFKIEAHFAEQSHNFYLGDPQAAFQYNLNSMCRLHPRTKHQHRIKRTPFIWDQPEGLDLMSMVDQFDLDLIGLDLKLICLALVDS